MMEDEIDVKKLPGYREVIPEGYKRVIYLSWEEWEPCFWMRPDGCSLHLTQEDAKKFVDDFADRWLYPVGKPVPVYVSPDLYEKIIERERSFGLYIVRNRERELVKEGKLIYTEERSGWVFRDIGGMKDK
ncbi:hypothetical protein AciM339_1410 [Aciduliprofundum sp. MAR08-339]|nr:hypothetical protein AciM339_1410 [Aciduliprofundum sp. MAR08-339]